MQYFAARYFKARYFAARYFVGVLLPTKHSGAFVQAIAAGVCAPALIAASPTDALLNQAIGAGAEEVATSILDVQIESGLTIIHVAAVEYGPDGIATGTFSAPPSASGHSAQVTQ